MIGLIFYLVVIGLVAVFIARAVVSGKDALSVFATMVLGIVERTGHEQPRATLSGDHPRF